MGILAGLLAAPKPAERRNMNAVLMEMRELEQSSGVYISEKNALKLAAVWAAVRAISETMAMLPLILYRRKRDGSKDRATDHPLYDILHIQPNETMPAMQWLETGQQHVLLWGNAYSQFEYAPDGRITAIYPLDPEKMEVEDDGRRLRYIYNQKPMAADTVLHIPGLGNGRVGYPVISMARRSLEYSAQLDATGAAFFRNGAQPGGVLEHPGQLSEAAQKNLIAAWEARHKGGQNSAKLAILEEGMTYKPLTMPLTDAQYIESRNFQISEIARWFRVPPHMLADLERATFSNIEHLSLEFVNFTLQPWLTRWEQWLTIRLLTAKERRQGYFIEFLVDGLLRGDVQARYNAYQIGRQNGWLSANDIRRMENMNPITDGDIYLIPLNMIPADQASEGGNSNTGGNSEAGSEGRSIIGTLSGAEKRARDLAGRRYRLSLAQRKVFADLTERIIRREKNDISAKAQKMLGKEAIGKFEDWLRDFYKGHADWTAKQALPSFAAYAEIVADVIAEETDGKSRAQVIDNFIAAYAAEFGSRNAARHEVKLLEILRQGLAPDEILTELDDTLTGWSETAPDALAHEEAVRLNNAASIALYAGVGAIALKSIATGESTCPYCRALDGKTIGINEFFLTAGQDFQPEGAEKPLTVSSNHRHSPYHAGCDCMVVMG